MPSVTSSSRKLPANVTIRHEWVPGDIGYLTYLHGILYASECGWDYTFEAYVAVPMSAYAKSHTGRERIWIVEKDGEIKGSIAIVQRSMAEAQLRWLLLHPDLRGYGIGKFLVGEAIKFCRECNYGSVHLWTVRSLKAAKSLYEAAGFQLTEEKTNKMWGSVVVEQRYDLKLR